MWFGACGYSKYRGITSPVYTILKPKIDLNPIFFHYLFRTKFYQNYSKRFSYGIMDERLSLRYLHFKHMYSIVPPLEVQKRIVEYLDNKNSEIDKFIRNKERLVELLEEEKAHFISEKVSKVKNGWENKKIKYASKVLRGKFTHRPRNDESLYNGEYPFIQTGDVARASKYIIEYSQTLNKLGYNVTTEFPKGTIVMTIAANIGDVAILGFNACFPDSVIGFFPKKNILNDFLYYALKVKKDDFLQTAIVNTQMNLNVERVSSIFIDIPPIAEQQKIVSEIEEHEKYIYNAISKAQKEISSIKEYREALITDLVTGKRMVPQSQLK
jgi:type I restriction enzyme S subunit